MTDTEMIRAIEANVPGAVHMVNFWVAREVLERAPEVLGPPVLLGWEIDDVEPPAYEHVLEWVEALPPLPPAAPSSVTRRQGRLALLDAGRLDDVETAIEAIQDVALRRAAQIEYEADTWERSNTFLRAMWAQLGGTEAELDALFVLAVTK